MGRHEIAGENTTSSEVMISPDSLSFPSAPPDIGNWFSSYVYQSPELDSTDDLKYFREFRENVSGIQDRENENGDGEIVSNGFVQCVNSFGDDKSQTEDLGSPHSLSCSSGLELSEPPDVENWFSSYEYESPALDGSEAFLILDQSDKKCPVTEQGAISNRKEKEEDFRDFSKDTETDHQQLDQQSHEADIARGLTGNLKRRGSDDNGSTYDGSSHKDLYEDLEAGRVHHRLSKMNKDSDQISRKSPVKAKRVSNGKENCGNGIQENGFISTRKNKTILARDENHSRKPPGFQSCSSRSGATDSLPARSNAPVRRKILSERTNFQQPNNVLEITGEWKCPQSNKPILGPPLKQLRLEQWLRRA